MTYEELYHLIYRMNSHSAKRKWKVFISSEVNFFDDPDCPVGYGEIRVRMGPHNGLVGRVLLNQHEMEQHTAESLELLIDEVGISALLSHGDLYDEDCN